MCTYTVKKQKLRKSSRGVHDSTERPKIWHLRRKGFLKNKQRLRHVKLHTGRL